MIVRHSARVSIAALGLLALVMMAAIAHLGLGARYIAPPTVVQALIAFDPHNFEHRVIISLRLLRLVAAIFTGGALGVAGALLQSVIRNPLGEPHILGLNAGAALAVVATTALGITVGDAAVSRPLIAATGAAILFSLVMLLCSAGRAGFTPMKVTLCGVALSAFASSITAAILILDEQTLLSMRTWLAGDLAGLSWAQITPAAMAATAGFALAIGLAPALNMLALGDTLARGLGVSLARIRLLSLLAIALLCGAAVAIAGPVGFVGLVVPHMVRRLAGSDLRVVIPLSALGGAALLLLADIAARTLLSPQELATGVMTALVGAPLFMLLAARFFK
ncbi:iron ABC transporter permease [Kosakonia cowanii]|uniref:FecCD family ABC transporter permease n=1 Tax=Kosakonia cowanii TaxID=208223 RepID=UPI00111D31E7|nr:iron ABC transporter permease [Kosakonia cowanii]MDP9769958.1 iron complex transport system permease protein [Atlantibacter hermannii]TPD62404.1 iron ABC transporter permease [Kosakonia cowanii]TPD86324.1 iron ABC transporter permease [Kosakonia cowanii]TPE02902.1 iron ABC transporter permease [Kosakonia cowanii]